MPDTVDPALNRPLTMEDFADCITDRPLLGEDGYVGDDPARLEYPCNCCYCRGEAEPSRAPASPEPPGA